MITIENLVEKIDEIGPWTAYGLAKEALRYYFPEKYNDEEEEDSTKEMELMSKLGCKYLQDIIVKYHKEIGYKGFFNNQINEY